MEGLLVTGGDAPKRERLASRFRDFALVCAADSGLDILRAWDLEPDIIVGDMDSVSDASLLGSYPRAAIAVSPRDKDETDTELGLAALRERGATRITLAGGGGGRLDHLLAIRAIFERRLRPAEWHTALEAVFLVEEGSLFMGSASPGGTVSVFPLGSGADGMASEGLAWPLAALRWGPGDFGVSNIAVGGDFAVRAGRGDLLVVVARP